MPKNPLKNLKTSFLLPAGYLPVLAPYSVFKYYAEMFSYAGGFEYFYMIDQDPQLVNHSPIGGKIRGVHGPWTQLRSYTSLDARAVTVLIGKREVAGDLVTSARKTFAFAKNIGAQYVVLHSIDLVPGVIEMAKDFGVKLYLEPDVKLPGRPPWQYNTLALWEKFKISVVFDIATVEWNGESVFEEWKKVKAHVGHVHLNEYQPAIRKDQGILKSPQTAELLKMIAADGYDGYFTFEVSPLQSQKDKVIAGFFLLMSLAGLPRVFPAIEKWYAGLARKNLLDSIRFAQKYL